MADEIEIVGLADPRPGAARALADAVAGWSPNAGVFAAADEMLAREVPHGVFNLTPAPLHGIVNRQILETGAACYSEKPLASSLIEANDLIDLARGRGTLFLCAPGSAVTNRFQWLKALADSGELGRPTLATAHHADAGPAAWPEYTGDPTPFYREGVGPVIDHGVYRLHEMTWLLGPVRRVQAMGAIAIPRRRVRGGPRKGSAVEVTTPDHVLIQLEFTSGALGQVLASFGTLETMAPWLELHLERGVVTFGGKSWEKDAPVSISRDDPDDPNGVGLWSRDVEIPRDEYDTVATGARHFLACLLGRETPVLTAEHARHVLDVMLKTYASIADGATHATETAFGSAILSAP